MGLNYIKWNGKWMECYEMKGLSEMEWDWMMRWDWMERILKKWYVWNQINCNGRSLRDRFKME